MSRDDFIDWLARLVSDDAITEDEALEMLREYNKGAFQWDAPLPIRRAIQQQEANPLLALPLLLALLKRRNIAGVERLPPIASSVRPRLLAEMQDAYKQQVRTLARNLSMNGGVAEWQQGMNDLLAGQLNQSMLLAHGRTTLTPTEVQRLQATLSQQQAFLSRFADFLSLSPQSEAYVAARSDLYGNSARSLYWQESELEFVGQGSSDGWLLKWNARDDGRTCPNCHELDGKVFVPGTPHPVPGESGICFGRCRCGLEYFQDMALWQQLRI